MDLFDKRNLSPMLIAENKPAFDDEDYIYELKFDGIRCIAFLDKDKTELYNKRAKRITDTYPELGSIHKQIKKRCILDGEVFVMDGIRPNFFDVQKRSLMTNSFKIQLAAARKPATFTAFDILYLDNQQITDKPLLERKRLLKKNLTISERMAISMYVEKTGVALYDAVAKLGLEGIVAKRKDSPYYFGKRTKNWIKCKALLDEDFIVCGYYYKSKNLISVILGSFNTQKIIIYRGHVVMGLSKADFSIIQASEKTSSYPGFPDFEDAIWLEPGLVCNVDFMEYTKSHGLRQPRFRGLRNDKDIKECITEIDSL